MLHGVQPSTADGHAAARRPAAAGKPPADAAAAGGGSGIDVPSCRPVADYALNERAMSSAPVMGVGVAAPHLGPGCLAPGVASLAGLSADAAPSDLHASAYIIYQDVVQERRAEAGTAAQVRPAMAVHDGALLSGPSHVSVSSPAAPSPWPSLCQVPRPPTPVLCTPVALTHKCWFAISSLSPCVATHSCIAVRHG